MYYFGQKMRQRGVEHHTPPSPGGEKEEMSYLACTLNVMVRTLLICYSRPVAVDQRPTPKRSERIRPIEGWGLGIGDWDLPQSPIPNP
jgi:hypothetical protein